MKHCASRPASRIIASLATVMIVFGLAILMVVERYNPAVITTVVTGTSLAAAELVRCADLAPQPPHRVVDPPKVIKQPVVSAARSIAEAVAEAVAQIAHSLQHSAQVFAEVSPVSAGNGSYKHFGILSPHTPRRLATTLVR